MSTTPGKKKLSTLDRSFLASERRDVMMHVGALLELSPSKGVSMNDFSAQLRQELSRDVVNVQRPWDLRLDHPELLANPVQSWIPDENFDIEYHVRRSALPTPGDERELGALVSRLHGTPLDFHRPPWEAHFIEGLEKKRLAIYFKVHHALVDGYTGMRLLARSLSTDPSELDTPLFFERPPVERAPKRSSRDLSKLVAAKKDADQTDKTALVTRWAGTEQAATLDALLGTARDQIGVAKDFGRALMTAVKSVRGRGRDTTNANADQFALPQAPKSILNQRISRSRRFATQQVSIDRVKKIAASSGGTVNDVILAICGAALRRFLDAQDALPDQPLVAMVPVNVRPKDDPGGGNAVGAILASLATDLKNPRAALDAIIVSTRRAKEQLQGMSKNGIIQYSALVLAPMMLSFIPGAVGRFRPAFNVVISNVPGPETPLYLRGWRLDEMYPLSIPFHGYALNITVQSYAGALNFGFTGCRDTVPHLQRLAVFSGEVLEDLERGRG